MRTRRNFLTQLIGVSGAFGMGEALAGFQQAQAFDHDMSFIYNIKDSEFGAKGDGLTEDTAAIQAAIDRAGEVAGIVYLDPGIYVCATLNMKTGVLVTGPGVLKLKAGANVRLVNFAAGVTSARLVGVTLDGNSANNQGREDLISVNGATRSAIIGCMLVDAQRDGIGIGSANENLLIQNCTILAPREDGIILRDGENIRVLQCQIEDAGSGGNGDGIIVQCTHVVVSQCTVLRAKNGGIVVNTEGDTIAAGITISQNVVAHTGLTGIHCTRSAPAHARPSDITISGNVVRYAGDEGIRIVNCGQVSILGNTVAASGDRGVEISSSEAVTLSNNVVHSSQAHGIDVFQASDVTVVGNVVKDAGAGADSRYSGVYVHGTDSASENVTVASNAIVSRSQNRPRSGIRIDGRTVNSAVSANVVSGFTVTAQEER